MASPLKKHSSEATVNTMVGATRVGKTFVNDEARQRYSSDLSHRPYTAAWTVDFEFFNKVGIGSFKKLEHIGWGAFFSLIENIYPKMIKEFYANVIFDHDELWATSLIKGHNM